MYFPLVRERVWIRGCTHEFVVVRADYAAFVATVSPVELPLDERHCSFEELFNNFKASKTGPSVREELSNALHSSWVCVKGSKDAVKDLRQATNLTREAISRTMDLIAKTDQVVARWRSLGCKP